MSGRKTIQINPAFFNMRGSKSRRKERKQKPSMTSTLKPNNIKKQLLKRIKEHQQQKKADSEKQNTTEEEKFTNELSTEIERLLAELPEAKNGKK